jgi:hypothetical protein
VKVPLEWKELIDSLCSNRVRFLVVGAHALAVHGRPRATGDLDIFVEPTATNARRVSAALAAYGFPALAHEVAAFSRPDRMATLGREPLRVDIMTSISGVSFAQAWKGRVRAKVGGRTIAFLGRREFLRNKKASGRPKDMLDVALLEEARATSSRPSRR